MHSQFGEGKWLDLGIIEEIKTASLLPNCLTPTCVDKSQESPFSVPYTISIPFVTFRFPMGAASSRPSGFVQVGLSEVF